VMPYATNNVVISVRQCRRDIHGMSYLINVWRTNLPQHCISKYIIVLFGGILNLQGKNVLVAVTLIPNHTSSHSRILALQLDEI
jgi:hypothetical protein